MVAQAQALNKILQNKDLSMITNNNLTVDYFFNYRAEYNFIRNHYEQHRCIPDRVTFAAVFPDFEFFDVQEPDNFLLEKLYYDYNSSLIVTNFNKVKSSMENGHTDVAMRQIVDLVDNLRCGAAMTSIDLTKDTSRFDRYIDRGMNKHNYYISTGFPELDQVIGGVDCENEDFVIAARTGRGKTWCLLKMAAAASIQGRRVGIYSGEMSADKVGYRLDTLIGQINNKSITRGDLYIKKSYQTYIETLEERNLGPIFVFTPNDVAGPVTVDVLRAFIEKEKLDILFVDQYSLLDDIHKGKTVSERIGNIARDIKKLQVEKQIPIITVAQMNRDKNEDQTLDTTQIGLSDLIPQYATILIMLERKEDKLTLNIVKARDGGDDRKLEYRIDLNTGFFDYIPSEYDGITSAADIEAMRQSYEPASAAGEIVFGV